MIKIYTTSWCPHCVNAKRLLDQKGYKYEEINIEEIGMDRQKLAEITGGSTVPQIVIKNQSIGGYSDLTVLNSSGKLDEMMI